MSKVKMGQLTAITFYTKIFIHYLRIVGKNVITSSLKIRLRQPLRIRVVSV
jgi:hypothetical protein